MVVHAAPAIDDVSWEGNAIIGSSHVHFRFACKVAHNSAGGFPFIRLLHIGAQDCRGSAVSDNPRGRQVRLNRDHRSHHDLHHASVIGVAQLQFHHVVAIRLHPPYLTKNQPIDVPIPSRTGYVLLPPELSDPDPLKAMEKQFAFAKKTKEQAAPAKA